MSEQKPSVGRIVQYFPPGVPFKAGGYPAVITHVWGDLCVNLNVFNDGSHRLAPELLMPTSVMQINPEKIDDIGWQWPPRV